MPKILARSPQKNVDGVLLLDKPLGLSSNQALQQVRRLFRAVKAGHTGSLDPLATGLLPVCFGEATKLCGYLLESDKRYVAIGRFGERTATGDAEGGVIARSEPASIVREHLEQALRRFIGKIHQVPPMYSALKYQGQPLYRLAREGVEVEREAREVTIHSLELTMLAVPEFELHVSCSKGTYIRTLVEDVAAAIGQQAHLIGLRRVGIEPFEQPRMYAMDELMQISERGEDALHTCLISPAKALSHWPHIHVSEDRAFYLSRGQTVRFAGAPRHCLVAVLDAGGRLLGIAETDAEGVVAPKRWLRTLG